MTESPQERTPNRGKIAKDLNDSIRYTMWSVFKVSSPLGSSRTEAAAEVCDLVVLVGEERSRPILAGLQAASGWAPQPPILSGSIAARLSQERGAGSRSGGPGRTAPALL